MFLVTSFPWDYECFIINSLIYIFMTFCLPSYAFQTNMMCYIITVLTCILIIIFDRFMVYLLQLVLQSFFLSLEILYYALHVISYVTSS